MAISSITNHNGGRTIRSCSLELTAESLDPQLISTFLGNQADRSFKRGDISFRGRPQPHGLWSVDSDHHISSDNLREHIRFIVDFLEQRRDKILQTKISMHVSVRVRVFWDFENTISVAVDHNSLKVLSDIVDGLDLSIT